MLMVDAKYIFIDCVHTGHFQPKLFCIIQLISKIWDWGSVSLKVGLKVFWMT